MEKEAKANRRRCFLGENCRAHGLFTICVADKLIKGGQGQNGGGIFVYIFILFYFLGALPFIIKDNCFQFFTSTVWTQFFLLPVELLLLLLRAAI